MPRSKDFYENLPDRVGNAVEDAIARALPKWSPSERMEVPVKSKSDVVRSRAGQESQDEETESRERRMGSQNRTYDYRSKMPPGASLKSPLGDVGALRQREATRAVKAFKGDGKVMKASDYFGSAKPNASKAGNSPS